MGKKSKAKKLAKLKEHEKKVAHEKKHEHKEHKETHKEGHKLPKIKISKKKFFGGVFVLIMVLILVSVGYLLFAKAFRSTPVAKYLPKYSTIAFLELNTNEEHNQYLKTFDLLKNQPKLSKAEAITYLENTLGVSYETDIKSWLGREAGVAYLNSKNQDNKIYKVYFAEVLSEKNAKFFIKEGSEKDYDGKKIYQWANAKKSDFNSPYIVFVDDYLFASEDEDAIKELLDLQKEGGETLNSSGKYNNIDNNLPISKAAFLYLDFSQMNNEFFKEIPFLSEKGISMVTIESLLKLFDAEGLALVALDNNFEVDSFTSLNADEFGHTEYLNFSGNYTAQLADYVVDNTLAFWGGINLESQTKRIAEVISGADKGVMSLFNNLVENFSKKYFGPNIDPVKDIWPLFEKEYALAIEKIGDKEIYKLIVELDDPKKEALKLQDLANNFAQYGGIYTPKVVEHTLPDGTKAKEIIAIPGEIQKEEIKYKDTTIYRLKMNEDMGEICYAFINSIAVIANDLEGVKSTIDIISGEKKSLRQSTAFIYNIRPVLRNSDEITYMNLSELLPIFFDGEEVPEVLTPIEFFSSGGNYSKDGVKMINYFHIK